MPPKQKPATKKRTAMSRKPATKKRAAAPKKPAGSAKRITAKRARVAALSGPRGVIAKVREVCLALPDAKEVEAWGHPTFRIANKIFAGCGAEDDGASMSVKTTHDMQAALVSSDPRFSIAAYVGKHGWVTMRLDGDVNWAEVEALVRASYDLIAPAKKRTR
jgi:predicted DNA-binding protein (MmcQ/YjbR family)